MLAILIRHPITDVTLVAADDNKGREVSAVFFGEHRIWEGARLHFSYDRALKRYARLIRGFLDCTIKDLSAIPLALDTCTPFRKAVLNAARTIPWGRVVSYRRLALMAGLPAAVRGAASVMRANRFPLIVPCHRVIRSDGTIGGFAGKMKGKSVALKRRLLQREGVVI